MTDEEFKKNLSKNLIDLIDLRKQQQKHLRDFDIAKKCNINKSTFSEYKNGKKIPNALTLRHIADFFGVSMDNLTKELKN